MFKALSAIVRHTPMHLMITQQGELLSVILIPKPTGDAAERAGLRAPIHATGTAEDLDRDLPARLQEYLEKVIEVRAKIDLPLEALEKTAAGEDDKDDDDGKSPQPKPAAKAKKAVKPAPKKPAPKPAPKAAPMPVAKPPRAGRVFTPANAPTSTTTDPEKATPEPSAAAPAAAAAPAPVATPAPSPAPTPTPTTPRTTAGAGSDPKRPTREQCLEDYRQACAAAGKPLNRAEFIAAGTTGRRYEKHWNNDWKAFTQEAMPLGLEVQPGLIPPTVVSSTTRLNPALAWPFPRKTEPTEPTEANPTSATTDTPEETTP